MDSSAHTPLLLLLLLFLAASLLHPSSSLGFHCSTNSTCQSLVGYVSPNTTTLASIQTLFNVKHLRSILGANKLPPSTPSNYTVHSLQTIAIPFNCSCSNSTGVSKRSPIYTVVPGDTLYHIATEVFAGLLVYQDIEAANHLPNASLIVAGENLSIPLPCSCDDVQAVGPTVHYAHVVAPGSSIAAIGAEFNVSQTVLMAVNGITDAKSLQAGEVLDVPLKACSSAIRNNSLDSSLRVANGTYVITANNCVMCTCDAANNWTLQCQPSQLKSSNWSICPSMQCEGSQLYISNSTLTSCNRTTCAYAGYTSEKILTTLVTESTCAPNGSARRDGLQAFGWNFLLSLVLLLLSLHHLH